MWVDFVYKIFKIVFVVLFVCALVYVDFIGKEVRSLKKKTKRYSHFLGSAAKGQFTPPFGKIVVPSPLQPLPFGEDSGLILGVKDIVVRNVIAPYNATMIEDGEGYLLFFRYDLIQKKLPGNFVTYVGCAKLDSNFQQTAEEFRKIDTGSDFSEDPRVLTVGNSLYLVYNDVHPTNHTCRTMRIGKFNLNESKLEFVTDLDLQIKPVEKNWVPFEYVENGVPQFYLEYSLNPHKILKVEDPRVSAITHLIFPNFSLCHKFFWPSAWGEYVKGGSPAKKIGNAYLGFFHTFFVDEYKTAWYTMGAYTFEENPPFRINAVSHYPILYKGIYNSPPINTADPTKRVVFPGGFVEREIDGKKVIHLVCGENDCSIKVITFDKNLLLESMKKI